MINILRVFSYVFLGVLAFYFFNGNIRVSPDIFQAELLNYWWLPVIVRTTTTTTKHC